MLATFFSNAAFPPTTALAGLACIGISLPQSGEGPRGASYDSPGQASWIPVKYNKARLAPYCAFWESRFCRLFIRRWRRLAQISFFGGGGLSAARQSALPSVFSSRTDRTDQIGRIRPIGPIRQSDPSDRSDPSDPSARRREDEKARGREGERVRRPEDRKTRRPEDQKTRRPEDQKTRRRKFLTRWRGCAVGADRCVRPEVFCAGFGVGADRCVRPSRVAANLRWGRTGCRPLCVRPVFSFRWG